MLPPVRQMHNVKGDHVWIMENEIKWKIEWKGDDIYCMKYIFEHSIKSVVKLPVIYILFWKISLFQVRS